MKGLHFFRHEDRDRCFGTKTRHFAVDVSIEDQIPDNQNFLHRPTPKSVRVAFVEGVTPAGMKLAIQAPYCAEEDAREKLPFWVPLAIARLYSPHQRNPAALLLSIAVNPLAGTIAPEPVGPPPVTM